MVKTDSRDGPAGGGKATTDRRFDEADCLLAAIQSAGQGAGSVRVEVPGAGSVVINAEQQCFWSRVRCEQTFFGATSAQAQIELEPAGSVKKGARPLDELLWWAAWAGSDGALLRRCQLYDVISLKYWPNLTRLPHVESLFPLCSLLFHRATSMSFAYRMLRVPEPDAYRFFSAATAAGYLIVVSSQPTRAGPAGEGGNAGLLEQGVGRFWSSLFKRIAGL